MRQFDDCKCGGRLEKDGSFYVCDRCGTRYITGRDDEGNPFLCQQLEKQHIECGQIAVRSENIAVNEVVVREIKLDDDIGATVASESMNINKQENIALAETFIAHRQWEGAQNQINAILVEDVNCPEAKWFNMMCEHHAATDAELISRLSGFNEANGRVLDQILSHSSAKFAKRIIDLFFDGAYLNDTMCYHALSVILPYARNEIIYTPAELDKKIKNAFEKVISKIYPNSLEFLLKNALRNDEVDRYIDYLTRFGDKCLPAASQKYYSMALEVDKSNLPIHRKLIKADISADSGTQKTVGDFEELLKYCQDADTEVITVLKILCGEKKTTAGKCDTMWKIMGYHSAAPEALEEYIYKYASILLESSLWDRAREYYNLALTLNARSAEAYFGLCMVRFNARNESDLTSKKENIIDSPEFKKALSIYQADKNTKAAQRLMSLTDSQKNKRTAKKFFLIAGGIILVIVLLVNIGKYISHSQKYSVKNIDIELINTEYVTDPVTELYFEITNGCKLDVYDLIGTLRFYVDGEQINESTVTFSNLTAKTSGEVSVSFDSDTVYRLYEYKFKEMKITYAVTEVTFSDYTTDSFGKGKERVLKKGEKIDKEAAEKALNEDFEEAMSFYDGINFDDFDYEAKLEEFSYMLDPIWQDIMSSEELSAELYSRADGYYADGDNMKAYFIFSLLASAGYEDSQTRAEECAVVLQ